MAASTSQPMPLTFRQYTTLNKSDLPQGRIVEYVSSPRVSEVETLPQTMKNPNLVSSSHKSRPKPWASATSNLQTEDRKRKLAKMNLRGDNRRGSRSSATPKTNSSCKRSDSATNDSQRSALTSESLEERSISDATGENTESLTEDDKEKKRNYEKCMRWMERLPAKFSGMHIAQERAPSMKD